MCISDIAVCSSVYSSIFLIDHAWTYEAEFARKQLRSIPGLARRMVVLMDLEDSLKSSSADSFYANDNGTVILTKNLWLKILCY